MTKVIIIDRDGVINFDTKGYIKSPDEWSAIPGSLEAIAQFNRSGYQVFIATNQSGIGRGFYDVAALDTIHEKLMNELAAVGGHVEEIFFCPHHPNDDCGCRKPKPGLFHSIQKKYQVDLTETFFIGDSWSDVQAAVHANCQPVLVLTGNGQRTLAEHPELKHILNFANLAAAADYICHQRQEKK